MAPFASALLSARSASMKCLAPDRINQLARGMSIKFRRTLLTPDVTLDLFARQIAHGNIACSAVRHLAGFEFSDVA